MSKFHWVAIGYALVSPVILIVFFQTNDLIHLLIYAWCCFFAGYFVNKGNAEIYSEN